MSAQAFAAFAALIGLATIAVIVSHNANTAAVIQAVGGGVGAAIGAAVSPVTQSGNSQSG
jgi:hypothetical protein